MLGSGNFFRCFKTRADELSINNRSFVSLSTKQTSCSSNSFVQSQLHRWNLVLNEIYVQIQWLTKKKDSIANLKVVFTMKVLVCIFRNISIWNRLVNKGNTAFNLAFKNTSICFMQHYDKVHNEKIYSCSNCSKRFATTTLLKSHMNYCGREFKCSCGVIYKSNEALLTHAKRKNHTLGPLPRYFQIVKWLLHLVTMI